MKFLVRGDLDGFCALALDNLINLLIMMLAGAALSAAGLLHAVKVAPFDVVADLRPAWPWVGGYLALAGLLAALPWATRPDDDSPGM